jgi:acetyl coenzyme A synthetase (ADP forming)-like protein
MSLDAFFNPDSVAVIGASRSENKVGHEILVSLVRGGFEGGIYPVNPKAEEIEGLTCYPDLKSIGKKPGLVVIAVPVKAVAGAVAECAQVGVKAIIVITAGFREVGEEGARLEKSLLQTVRRTGMRMIGPNCLGLMVPAGKLNASFGGELPPAGGIGYMSQSGSLLAAILDMAIAENVGFSKLISIGNKADVDEIDVIKALGQDPDTSVIAGYLETIADGDAFVQEAERISRRKPILLMKSGITGAGARAASSHTGTLATGQAAYEVVFERAGVIRCASSTQQFDFARAFAGQPLPSGPNVAVVANGGGPGIMAADAVESHGLELAELAPETRESLRAGLPANASVDNPIDVLGDASHDRYAVALRGALSDPNVNAILVLLTPHGVTEVEETARTVVEIAGSNGRKPVLACFLGGRKISKGVAILREGGVPCYESPESAVATIKVMADYGRWRSRPERVVKLFPVNRRKVEQLIRRHLTRGVYDMGEMDAKEILEAYGFVTPRGTLATSAEQAANMAEQIGYPVVLKIWSPDIIHKSDVDGVRSNLHNAQDVMDAFDLMMYRIPKKVPDADILGVLVEEMITQGQEVILGMSRDPRFGPLMMFGMGGIMVETLREVAFYPAPLAASEAREMLLGTRTYQLLNQGVEGGVDIDAIAEGLQRLSQLVTEFPQIQEMDINPYVIGPEGTTPIAVDARLRVAEA